MNEMAYPLSWPLDQPRTPMGMRERGQFTGTLDRTRRDLIAEVDRIVLGSRSRTHTQRRGIVISTNMRVRNDGEIHASAGEPADPGVALYFTRKEQRVCFACDKYDRVWKNLRALALTIEAMRGIERWGSAQLLDRAFTGFAALPAKRGPDCWEMLGLLCATVYARGDAEAEIMRAWREKAKTAHPDAGGSAEAFQALNEAKDIALATVDHWRTHGL